MNKLIIGSVLCAASVVSAMQAHAQGQMTFTGGKVNLSTTGGRASPSSAFDYGFYVGSSPASISSTPLFTLQGGGFGAGVIGATQTIANQPAGTAEYFEIKGWSASLGVTSWEAAQAAASANGITTAFAGVSPIGFVTLSAPPLPPIGIFGVVNLPDRQINIPAESLVLSPILLSGGSSTIHLGTVFVPEPGSLGIMVLGCAAAALARRGK